MSYGSKFRKLIGTTIICCLFFMSHAQAFVWPVTDLAEVTSFINKVNAGIKDFSNTTLQIKNGIAKVQAVGDEIKAAGKYVTDLKDSITSIKNSVTKITDNIEYVTDEAQKVLDGSNEILEENKNSEIENSENLKNNVEDLVDSGAKEEEVQNVIDEAKKESENNNAETNKKLDEIGKNITDTISTAKENLNKLSEAGKNANTGKDYQKDIDRIGAELDEFEQSAQNILDTAKKKYNAEYSQKVTNAFDKYSQAVNDYYNGTITREALSAAGDEFKESIVAMNTTADTSEIDKLLEKSKSITEKTEKLKEEILNDINNSKDYSDAEEQAFLSEKNHFEDYTYNIKEDVLKTENGKYVFNFEMDNVNLFFSGIYAEGTGENGSYLISKELKCDEFGEFKNIEKNASGLRKCVVKAKAEKNGERDPYEDPLYEKYRKDGVYKHIAEDYSVANIVNISKAKQMTGAWAYIEEENENNTGAYYNFMKNLENINTTRDAYAYLAQMELESPKIWSEIRRVDALDRSRRVAIDFQLGTSLYLDGRDNEYYEANKKSTSYGTLKNEDLKEDETETAVGKNIFPNVMMYICNLKANDISFDPHDSQAQNDIDKKEKAIADCLFKYAQGASIGTVLKEDKSIEISSNPEVAKKEWQERQIKAYNDAAMNNLTLSVVNNYKSSLDIVDKSKLENPEKDKNIRVLQQDAKTSTTARDDYASGAQINYYSAQQILSIVDADAQNVQTEIIKNLRDLTYNYFGTEKE